MKLNEDLIVVEQVAGAALLGLGIYVLVKAKDFQEIVETPNAAAILVIIIGGVTFFIAFLGCCGASSESSCMLTSYAIIVGIVFLAEAAAAVLLLVYTSKITDLASNGVKEAFSKYKPGDTTEAVNPIVDILQFSLQCCGVEGKDYWNGKYPVSGQVPMSCCFDPSKPSSAGQCGGPGGSMPFEASCATKTEDFLRLFSGLLAAILITAGVVKIIAACFACSLKNAQ
jgi:hypothetical protein